MEKGSAIMLLWLLVIVFGIVIILLWLNKIHIDWQSIPRPTLPLDRGIFGVYCFTGHQGTGKTYALTKYVQKNHHGRKIYSNLSLRNVDYTPIKSIDELYALAEQENIIIIYDEIFTLMSKSKKDREMLEQFLPQMRKVKNIFLTTAQYWLELDITFRRFVRVQVECNTRPLGRFGGVLIEDYNDTTQIQWDNLQNEYVSPRISKKLSKYERRYMESYNTYERIKTLKTKKELVVGGLSARHASSAGAQNNNKKDNSS